MTPISAPVCYMLLPQIFEIIHVFSDVVAVAGVFLCTNIRPGVSGKELLFPIDKIPDCVCKLFLPSWMTGCFFLFCNVCSCNLQDKGQ